MDDLPAAVEICELNERKVIGETTGLAQVFSTIWSLPGAEIEKDLRVIANPVGGVVGFVHVRFEPPNVQSRVVGFVHGDYEGLGLGTFLVNWAESRARKIMEQAPAGARTAMHDLINAGDERAARLLRRRGFEITRHLANLFIDLDGPPEEPIWPEGVELRPLDWDRHGRLISDARNDIFRDHWGMTPKSDEEAFERLRHLLEHHPDTDTALWFIAWAGDEVAGFSLCWPKDGEDDNRGYIASLGVRRPWRGRGLGLALLRHTFGELHKRGKRQAALHADAENITGAMRLYTKAGMHIHRQDDNYEKELRAGEELSVRELSE